jgi:hypothetical protein
MSRSIWYALLLTLAAALLIAPAAAGAPPVRARGSRRWGMSR